MINHTLKFLLFLLFFISCQDSPPLISKIRRCCETEAIVSQVGSGRIYVPNFFSPNFDGINDNLRIFVSPEITEIKKIEIKKGVKIVFSATNFKPFESEGVWDGTVEGEIVKGVFTVEIEILETNGIVQTLRGEVCSLPCNEKDKLFKNIDNCAFGTQHNGIGGQDENLPSFENLSCLE